MSEIKSSPHIRGVRMARIPHSDPVTADTWFTFVRGAMISRATALAILIHGPKRARIETIQSNNSEFWKVEDEYDYV